MATPVRLRFAPSPTGFLHIGGVRTALFNWLYARRRGGQFLLRIEDTDLERSEDRFTQDIMQSMKWLGLDWDEEPIFQSKRLDVYMAKAQQLVAQGNAYYCTCTAEDVEKMREVATAAGLKPQYDRRCRGKNVAPVGTPYVIRAAIPLDGTIAFDDLIRGPISFANVDVDDFVLIRSNGAPTYNLSVVVDDVESRMTHIVRGDDHINNTPKQMHLYQFFKYPVPIFAHLPMILGSDKKKLSKRHGAVSANVYRADGFLPEALLNFLARLGWSHGDQELFTPEELVALFDFDHAQKSGAVFNTEKLLWTNGEHMRKASAERLAGIVAEDYPDYFREPGQLDRVRSRIGQQLVSFIQPKVKLTKEIAEQLVPLVTHHTLELDASGLKWNKDASLKTPLQSAVKHVHEMFTARMKEAREPSRTEADAKAWGMSPALTDAGMTAADIEAALRQVCETHGVKLGDLAQPMRLAVTGRLVSAGLFELLSVMPWDIAGPRLERVASL